MCIGYLELNQLKVSLKIRANGLPFLFNILDHICTTSFVFGNLLKTFANSQRYRNMIARSIFRILKFLPLFQMLFLYLHKSSP
jgi:hypothetical protein